MAARVSFNRPDRRRVSVGWYGPPFFPFCRVLLSVEPGSIHDRPRGKYGGTWALSAVHTSASLPCGWFASLPRQYIGGVNVFDKRSRGREEEQTRRENRNGKHKNLSPAEQIPLSHEGQKLRQPGGQKCNVRNQQIPGLL